MTIAVAEGSAATGHSLDRGLDGAERQVELPAWDDVSFAAALARLAQGTAHLLLIVNGYTAYALQRDGVSSQWQPLGTGEFGAQCRQAIKPLLRGRMEWARVSGDPALVELHALSLGRPRAADLDAWLRHSAGLTLGREGDVTPAIKNELGYLAGWRCQFGGCGRDLGEHGATGGRGRFSYFAHIVAASADGPRGDPELSRLLASEPTNFLLLCDECHRLIDKIRPADFTVEALRKMREDSIAEVRRLLDTLRYPSVEVVAVVGNIAGQPAQFSIGEAHEALWGARLRSNQGKPARYFDPGGQHHDVHSPGYWLSLFPQLKHDLSQLQTLLNGTRAGAARPRLAIFPQHSGSVLLLAGRVMGDTAGVHVFQPHRNVLPGASRWTWPLGQPAPALGKYKVDVLRSPTGPSDAAILVVGLTGDVHAPRMPPPCAADGQFLLPTLRITGPTFDPHCIRHPDDLALFGAEVDRAMRTLQDEWRVRTVHLFVCAPASAVVTVGQKMQARHQANYVVYEATPGQPSSMYQPTIELSSLLVRELVSGQGHFHSLQP